MGLKEVNLITYPVGLFINAAFLRLGLESYSNTASTGLFPETASRNCPEHGSK